MAGLTLAGVTRRFPGQDGRAAVDAVDLEVADGELVAVLGPSGCGKTTLLRLVAGLEAPDRGRIMLGARTVAAPGVYVPPEDRRVGMVFQSHALWPHMTVARNAGFPLEVRGIPAAERARRVAAALAQVDLAGLEERRPGQLSGGQRQRVALARCLVMDPAVILLDEPLASLDPHLRATLTDELAAFHQATGATLLYVTHDQGEALALAGRVAVMDRGRLAQVAPPAVLYREPATAMVARFVGQGLVVPGVVVGRPAAGGRSPVDLLGLRLEARAQPGQAPGPAEVCIRPEAVALGSPTAPGLDATVTRVAYQGHRTAVEARPQASPALRLALSVPPETSLAPGQAIRLTIRDAWVIPDRRLE